MRKLKKNGEVITDFAIFKYRIDENLFNFVQINIQNRHLEHK